MSKNDRLYLDYNSTSPLSSSVIQYLASGDFFYGNPSSTHSSGKKSKKAIREVEKFLYKTYSLNSSDYHLLFHSGATEGLNMIIQGSAKCFKRKNVKATYFICEADHSCLFNQSEEIEELGHEVRFYPLDSHGQIDEESLVKSINEVDSKVVLSYTWVNNETGVINSLEKAASIKKRTGCLINVDGVQSVGKVLDWQNLDPIIDSYTFSGHKFGALKGIGWSFIKEDYPLAPILRGGGQQSGLRSGTENVDGIFSLKLALNELLEKQDLMKLKDLIAQFEKPLKDFMGEAIEIVGTGSSRSLTTSYIIIKNEKADIVLMAFDLDKIDVSSGSACSSGALEPSRTLLSMGYNEKEAKSAIRFSFGHYDSIETQKEAIEKVLKVLKRFV
ncbi:MAG: cysteine desulfurase family protein [Bacteriovoracaceae bacterium]